MLLKRLILCDVGLFRGRVELDLAPKFSADRRRPIVLIGGLNGTGKIEKVCVLKDNKRVAVHEPPHSRPSTFKIVAWDVFHAR